MKIKFTQIISSFAVCLMLIYAGTSSAATFTAVASGNWSYATTWSGGVVPPYNVTADEIVIGSGFVINLDQDLVINRSGLLTSASLTVDGELRTEVTGRKLTITRGDLNGSGTIQMGVIDLQGTSTLGFTGTIIADELHHSLTSWITTGDFNIKNNLHLMGSLSVGGELKLGENSTITIEGGSLLTTGSGTLILGTTYNVSYLSSSSTAGPELGGTGLSNVTVDVGSGNNVMLSTNSTIKGVLTLSSGEMNLNGNHLTIMGDVAASGSGTIGSSAQSDVTIEGSAMLSGALRFNGTRHTVRNFTINRTMNDSFVQLGSDLNVAGILNLSSGSIHTGNYTLDIMSGGNIIGGTKDHYVITGATGRFGMALTSGGAFVAYPVGTSQHYSPASIRLVSGGTGMVRVNAINEVYMNGTAGEDLSATQKMVKRTWNVSSDITASLNMDLKVMWSGAMEMNSFDRTKAYISHYSGGTWDATTEASATTEAEMYTITRTGITSLSPFAVFQSGATGIAEINAISGASIYPNPASEYLMINNVEHVNIEIVNTLGQVVKRSELNGSAPLNINDLDRGNYFIKISSDGASTVKKFVKL